MATRYHHTNIATTDVAKLESFYKEVFDLREIPGRAQNQIMTQGYGGHVAFLSDGTTEMHLATRDLDLSFRTGQHVNPLHKGHIAFRTDDIDDIKRRLTERGVPFSDFGTWAMKGWRQIFFYDPEGNVVEVHQVDDPDSDRQGQKAT